MRIPPHDCHRSRAWSMEPTAFLKNLKDAPKRRHSRHAGAIQRSSQSMSHGQCKHWASDAPTNSQLGRQYCVILGFPSPPRAQASAKISCRTAKWCVEETVLVRTTLGTCMQVCACIHTKQKEANITIQCLSTNASPVTMAHIYAKFNHNLLGNHAYNFRGHL